MPQNKRRRPPGRGLRRSSSGVSDVLGSIMLVGITVAVFAMLSFITWAALKPPSSLHADIAVTVQGGKVVLVHQGGQTLDATASRLRVTVGSISCTFTGTSGPLALFTDTQFGSSGHASRFKVGDTLNVTPVSPCPAITTQPVSALLTAAGGGGTQAVAAFQTSAGGASSCLADTTPPTVGSWLLGPSDVTNATTGTVNVTAALADDCSGPNDAVAPHLRYLVAASTACPGPGTFIDVGNMTHVGYNVWQGSVTDTWSADKGKLLKVYLSGVKDLAGNSGDTQLTSCLTEPIQGNTTALTYPATCTPSIGSIQGQTGTPTCPLAVSPNCGNPTLQAEPATCPVPLPATCPAFTPAPAGASVLYPGDCNEEADLLEAATVATVVSGTSSKDVTGSFAGDSCPASDSSANAFGAADQLYACFAGKSDKLKVSGFAAPPTTTGSPTKVELHYTGHTAVDPGGGSSANDKVQVFFNVGATKQSSIPAAQTFGPTATCTPAPCQTAEQNLYFDVTSSRSWLCSDIASTLNVLSVEADASTSNNPNHILVDSLGLRVTGCGNAAATGFEATAATKVTGAFLGDSCAAADSGPSARGLADGTSACYAGKTDKLNVYGFPATAGVSRVELHAVVHLAVDSGALAGTTTGCTLPLPSTSDCVKLLYAHGSSGGSGGTVGATSAAFPIDTGATRCGTLGLPAPCSSADREVSIDVSGDRGSWDLTTVYVEADASTSSNAVHLFVDALWLRVTVPSGSGSVVSNIYATQVVSADAAVTTAYHAELAPDGLYSIATTKNAKLTLGGYQPLTGTITKVEVAYRGHCVGTTATPCDTTKDKVSLSYKAGSYSGATKSSFLQSTSDTTTFVDVTGDGGTGAGKLGHAWGWADIGKLTVQAQAATHNDAVDTYADAVWVRVTATGNGNGLGVVLGFTGVPSGIQQTLEMRYRDLNSNDTFLVQVCQDALATCGTWQTRGVPLTSQTYFIWTYTLTATEWNGGAPRLQLVDNNPLSSPGILGIDYVRVGSA